MKLKTKQDLHLMRRIWHASWGFTYPFLYFYYFTQKQFLILIGIIIVFYLILEVIRLKNPPLHKKMVHPYKELLRESELRGINAGLYYNLSIFVAVLIFPKNIALLSALYIGFADPMAAIFGTIWGKKSIQLLPGKSLIGSLAAFFTCFMITILFLRNTPLLFSQLFCISLIGGAAGSLAELFSFKIDDNLTIPIVSGSIVWASARLLAIPL